MLILKNECVKLNNSVKLVRLLIDSGIDPLNLFN